MFHPSLCPCCSLSWQWTCEQHTRVSISARKSIYQPIGSHSLSPRNSVFHPVKPLSCWSLWAELECSLNISLHLNLVFTVTMSNINEGFNKLPTGSPQVLNGCSWGVLCQMSSILIIVSRKGNRCILGSFSNNKSQSVPIWPVSHCSVF